MMRLELLLLLLSGPSGPSGPSLELAIVGCNRYHCHYLYERNELSSEAPKHDGTLDLSLAVSIELFFLFSHSVKLVLPTSHIEKCTK